MEKQKKHLMDVLGLTEEQAHQTVEYLSANSKYSSLEKLADAAKESLPKLIEVAPKLVGAFRGPSLKALVFDLIVIGAVLTSVLLLALNNKIDACSTSTLLGGVIGYVLGTGKNYMA